VFVVVVYFVIVSVRKLLDTPSYEFGPKRRKRSTRNTREVQGGKFKGNTTVGVYLSVTGPSSKY
jgi:uncharacterized protein HemY